MPILFVPPVEFVSENREVSAPVRASAETFLEKRLAELGVRGAPARTESKGAFRGLREYQWNGPRDAILAAAFLLPNGRDQSSEFARVAALVWRADCLLAGAVWENGSSPLAGTPPTLMRSNGTLARARERTARSVSPVRWESRVEGGPLGKRLALILDAVGGERLAEEGWPVNATIARMACRWTPPSVAGERLPTTPTAANAAPADANADANALAGAWPAKVPGAPARKSVHPRRAHRVVRARVRLPDADPTTVPIGPPTWPRTSYEIAVAGGVFGEKRDTLVASPSPGGPPVPFDPSAMADAATRALGPLVHELEEAPFRITRRQARWVYIDRGRAYGLEIGTHLVGPGGSKLHVIHFAPDDAGVDAAVALVRDENADAPLKPGDVLSVDLADYPLRAGPKLETNPL
jgi:hypothetical protein